MSNDKYTIALDDIPEGHTPVGWIAHVKVLDEKGNLYFAQRADGLNDMEMFGLAQSMANSMANDLIGRQQRSDDI